MPTTIKTSTVAAAKASLPSTLSPTVATVFACTCSVTVVPVLAPLTVVPPFVVLSAGVVMVGYRFSPSIGDGVPLFTSTKLKKSFASGCFIIRRALSFATPNCKVKGNILPSLLAFKDCKVCSETV